jgi:hypothetical protein
MGALVLADMEAVDELAELGLTVEIIERVVRRADAEASMCTALDPPIMEGLTRWARTTRFLREELIPRGWRFDNPRSLPRTIHPSGEFAIVASTGDELTGLLHAFPRRSTRRVRLPCGPSRSTNSSRWTWATSIASREMTPDRTIVAG